MALSLIGALAVCSAVSSAVTIWLVTRPSKVPDVAELERAVTQLRLEVTDVVDKFTTLERRDRVRRMRDNKAEAEAPADPHELKRRLRAQAFGGSTQ